MEEIVFERPQYIEILEKLRKKRVIKVATGIRRAGKSSVFLMYEAFLKKHGVAEKNIIHLNLEDLQNAELLDYKKLYAYINEKTAGQEDFYVFIDEVQQCLSFEKALSSLFLNSRLDLYVTGSNAYFLSGELATLLSGRYVEIHILPLSFKEYLSFNKKDGSISAEEKKVMFSKYLSHGQFPYLAFLGDDEEALRAYMEGIFNTILIKDVCVREKINDVTLLQRIVKTVCSNVGSSISSKRITDTLISSGRKITGNTVERYLNALCDAFIFYEVPRFDIRGNEMLKTLGKYYLADTGLRNILIGSRTDDFGHMLENIVYLELKRRGNQVYVGKAGDAEIDFVCKKGNEISYYQVSASVLDEATRKRELSAFIPVKDNYPKYLLTLDDYDFGSLGGIIHKNIVQWMIDN